MLGEELRKARKAADTTQEQLAFAAGLHPTQISHLEGGKKFPPCMCFSACARPWASDLTISSCASSRRWDGPKAVPLRPVTFSSSWITARSRHLT